jgi:DNA invertase Pin-like site-specific DNA recombinase
MRKPKRAVGYVCDIPIPGTDLVISKDFQKQRIKEYAERERIVLAHIYEDENYSEDFTNQPGVISVLNAGRDVDTVLVERVWCLSRKRRELEPFMKTLDDKHLQLVSTSYLWDCLSQQVRHRYMGAWAEIRRDAARELAALKSRKHAA